MRRGGIGGEVAISGIGMTPLAKYPDRSHLELAIDGFQLALADSGIGKDEIDGLVCLSYGADYDRFLESVGLDVRYAYQGWSHGRFAAPLLQVAAMAIYHGMADTIAVVHGKRQRQFGATVDREMWRQGLGPHGESPAYGAVAPAYAAALAANRYFHRYGGGSEDLGRVAVQLREHARLNPGAVRRSPLTIEDHQSSRYIVDPLRLLDCCQSNDGGVCIILTTKERARDAATSPVYIEGMQGVHAGPQYHNFAHVGLGVAQQRVFTFEPDDLGVYAASGITRDDVDSLAVYDAFSPVVLFALERFGFCGPGEAMDFVAEGNIGLGNTLPVNTSGGLLSEGHLNGWNLFVEIVRQLRHECGERQVADARIIQWASFLGDSIVFRR